MFGSSSSFGAKPSIFGSTPASATTTTTNAEDIAVEGSPDDTVQALRFSPNTNEKPLLAAGSWDGVHITECTKSRAFQEEFPKNLFEKYTEEKKNIGEFSPVVEEAEYALNHLCDASEVRCATLLTWLYKS